MSPAENTPQTTLIVHGSARVQGNTAIAVERVVQTLGSAAEVMHLCLLDVRPYSYAEPPIDEFRHVVDRMLAHRQIVFATPVYWYAMSGFMKTLFDRFTDLLRDPESRQLGRSLAGRKAWLLATGSDEELPVGFTEPFSRTCTYLDMHWERGFYVRVNKNAPLSPKDLAEADKLASCLSGN